VTGSPAGTVLVDESRRPILVHLRMLQEWLMCGCECGGPGEMALAPAMGGGGGPLPPVLSPRPPGVVPLARVIGAPGLMPVTKTARSMALTDSHYFVIGEGAASLKLTLAASTPANAGRVHVIKNVDVGTLTVFADTARPDKVDDKASLVIKKKKTVTLIADGEGFWQVIGIVE
jgi:hypothetical protein